MIEDRVDVGVLRQCGDHIRPEINTTQSRPVRHDDRDRRSVGDGAKEENVRLDTGTDSRIVVRLLGQDRVITRPGSNDRECHVLTDACSADSGDEELVFSRLAFRDFPELHALIVREECTLACETSNHISGDRGQVPLLNVMLDLAAVQLTRVIEWSGRIDDDSLNLHANVQDTGWAMLRVEFACSEDSRELWIAELWEMGCSGITELEGGLRAFFDDASALGRLPEGARVEHESDVDWVSVSRSQWEPLEVGQQFYLVPEWRDEPAPEGRVRIPVNPGLACGTGAHEATRLCLRAIEPLLSPDSVLLDVGAGSGILSVAAGLLGASLVIACDEDPVATGIAQLNLQRSGVRNVLFTGSANALASECADVAVCNISADAAIALLPDLFRCLKTGGHGIVSGFEADELGRIPVSGEILSEGQWRAIVFLRR